MYIESVIKF